MSTLDEELAELTERIEAGEWDRHLARLAAVVCRRQSSPDWLAPKRVEP